MGSRLQYRSSASLLSFPIFLFSTMPMKAMKTMKAMKAMKAMKSGGSKAMTKGALTAAIAEEHELKQKVCREVLDSFVAIAAAEVKKNGIFNVPNLFRIKTRVKPATKAGTRMMFGKEVKVKAQPARTVVKAFAAAALKKHV